jgi:hypothetical protein
MNKQVMICGVDCHQGDANCTGKADEPSEATEAMVIDRARAKAHRALDDAEKAWYAYAGLCEVGPDRTR